MYKLSIIVPVYGVENYLHKCLDSIYSQTTNECQVILVDDKSPDRCGLICDEYKAKYPDITTVIHQENMGLGGARNSGMNVAKGEYLFFIDSDDTIPDKTIATLLEAIEEYCADIYIFPFRSVGENGESFGVVSDSLRSFAPISPNENKNAVIGIPSACSKIFRTTLFKETGVLFPSKVWYEDIRTVPKVISKANSIVYLEKDMYNYLQREGSIMNNAKVEKNKEIIEAFEDLITWFKKEGLYESYRQELDFLILDHAFVSATVRVLRSASASHHLVKDLRDFTFANVSPNAFKSNQYIASMPKNRRLILKLLKAKMYFAVKLIFKIKK